MWFSFLRFFGLDSYGQESDTVSTDTINAIPQIIHPADTLQPYESSDTIPGEVPFLGDGAHSPTRAWVYSAVLPGLGQIYNRKYWKLPIVYGIMGGVGYWIWYNTQQYRIWLAEYEEVQSTINQNYLKAWRRQVELSYITLVGAHALQILDAYVDAHLFYWDVTPDLTLRIEPNIVPLVSPSGYLNNNYGLKCSLSF